MKQKNARVESQRSVLPCRNSTFTPHAPEKREAKPVDTSHAHSETERVKVRVRKVALLSEWACIAPQ